MRWVYRYFIYKQMANTLGFAKPSDRKSIDQSDLVRDIIGIDRWNEKVQKYKPQLAEYLITVPAGERQKHEVRHLTENKILGECLWEAAVKAGSVIEERDHLKKENQVLRRHNQLLQMDLKSNKTYDANKYKSFRDSNYQLQVKSSDVELAVKAINLFL